jgi:hypothetical protein
MNLRKIKLALTVGLMNIDQHEAVPNVKKLMSDIQEAGSFLSQALVSNKSLGDNLTKKKYAIKFENCTIDLDLLSNPMTNNHTVQGFQVH